jgi:hypothetical protein
MRSFLILCSFCQAVAFLPLSSVTRAGMPHSASDPSLVSMQSHADGDILASIRSNVVKAACFGSTFWTVLGASSAVQAADEIEMAELPAPYVPVLFGVALLVGVGLLTGSLGDVLDEEASLGLQSGARAKKEIDRSRSSYFKKK